MADKKVNISFCAETRKNLKEDIKQNYDTLINLRDNHIHTLSDKIHIIDKKVDGLAIKLGLLFTALNIVLPLLLRLIGVN